MRRKNVSPKAISLLGANFDSFPGPNIEEVHAGSRSGTLTGVLGAGAMRSGAGASLGTRTRRFSGSPISAIASSIKNLVNETYLPKRSRISSCSIQLSLVGDAHSLMKRGELEVLCDLSLTQ